jgi:cytochrome c oxidase subunit 1
VVSSREPLWSQPSDGPTRVSGLSTQTREGLVTTVLDAVPDVRYVYPSPGIWPVIAAFFVGLWLIGSVFSVKATLWAMIPPAIAFIAWYWPGKRDTAEELALEKRP